MSDSVKTMIGHRKPPQRAGTKIGWAPEHSGEPTPTPPPRPSFPARSFVLQNEPQDLAEQPTVLAPQTVLPPQRRAHGSVPPPYVSDLDETMLAVVNAQPLPYARPLPAPALPLPPPPRYPTYPRASRFCEATAEIHASRALFVRRAYVVLFVALMAFGASIDLLASTDVLVANVSMPLVTFALDGWNWAAVLGAYLAVSWIADVWARHTISRATHYLALGCYVVVAALIYVPLLAIVESNTVATHIARDAALIALGVFTLLAASALLDRKRVSFLRHGLVITIGAGASLAAISLIEGFDLGLLCSAGAVFVAAMYILARTAALLDDQPTRYVAGALVLFASLPLIGWTAIRTGLRRIRS